MDIKIKLNLKKNLKSLVIAYIFICALMFVMQRNLMYIPATNINSPASYGLTDFSSITLVAGDGTHVQTWYSAANEGYPTIINFHGNGGNLSHRAKFFALLRDAGFGVLGLDYRGYGASEGSPSEEGLYHDARAAINHAIKVLSLPPEKIIIYGESLGTGVAVQMATEYKIAALILQSPFTSMSDAAKYHYPWLPVSMLLKDRYDSISKISNIHVPILLFHGDADNIIPIRQGKELFARANEPKQAIYFQDQGHNNLDRQIIVNLFLNFIREHHLIRDQ